MKKALLILALLFSLNSFASHLLGGMVTVAQTSYDSTSIGVYLVSDSQGIIPNSINVERWEMNLQGWYSQNGYVSLIKSSTISHQGSLVVTYISDYLDLDSNKYRFIYKNCCWGSLSNSSNSFNSEFVISADYWHIPNNSLPYAENPLWVNLQANTLNSMKPVWGQFNCFLSQFDGDSVNIVQSDLYSAYANGTFVPQVYTPLTMLVSNDSISLTPSSIGQYGTGFEINEYRNGQLIGTQRIQWTFRVVASTLNVEDLEFRGSKYAYVYDFNGQLVYEGDRIPWRELKGLYVIITKGSSEKVFVQ